jgi:hypothetical protein
MKMKIVSFLLFALMLVPGPIAAIDWGSVPTPYTFNDPVPEATYAAKVILWQYDDDNHTGSPEGAFTMALRIQGGTYDNRLIYDWWHDTSQGHSRIKAIATELDITLNDEWDLVGILDRMLNRTYDVEVEDYSTVMFQQCSRVKFLGYALP